MQTSCPSCGAETFPGARFCRRCGAALALPSGETGDVSPHAATVPLVPEEGRTTDGLVEGEERIAQPTARVSLAEMERILRGQNEEAGAHHSQPQPSAQQPNAQPNGPAVTRPDIPGYADEELTITVPRTAPKAPAAGDFEGTIDLEATQLVDPEATIPAGSAHWPRASLPETEAHEPATHEPEADDDGRAARAVTHATPPTTLPPRPGARPVPKPRRAWPAIVGVCAAVALLVAGGAWLAYKLLYRPALSDLPTQGPTAPVTGDVQQQFELKLQEAEGLLAAGDMEGALARLREANALDPNNTRAHRRLGELLLSKGARREAIEAFRALTRNAPYDFNAWRLLASSQFAEGLYDDAAESYRRALNLTAPGARPDANDLLSLAESLRLAGRADEARAAYEQLLSFAPPEIAEVARQHLSELTPAQATPTPARTPRPGEPTPTPQAEQTASADVPTAPPSTPQPTPQPSATPAPPPPASPAERYGRGVQLWSSNRGAALEEFRAAAAGGNVDAHYYLGLAYVEGRKAGSLQRAEVVAALQHFQLAQRGQHAAQARSYAQQLEKEFDRLRRQ